MEASFAHSMSVSTSSRSAVAQRIDIRPAQAEIAAPRGHEGAQHFGPLARAARDGEDRPCVGAIRRSSGCRRRRHRPAATAVRRRCPPAPCPPSRRCARDRRRCRTSAPARPQRPRPRRPPRRRTPLHAPTRCDGGVLQQVHSHVLSRCGRGSCRRSAPARRPGARTGTFEPGGNSPWRTFSIMPCIDLPSYTGSVIMPSRRAHQADRLHGPVARQAVVGVRRSASSSTTSLVVDVAPQFHQLGGVRRAMRSTCAVGLAPAWPRRRCR